ncbi:MAG TPA: T9SS type A sorting domain-containing protein [Chitinophagales bacterium]|nr:T9SS type A sorting domain-containing protein [Chitinophagales bacterium]
MKKTRHIILLWCCCLAAFSARSQNLVLNPSFEVVTACPGGISEFPLVVDWSTGNSGSNSCTTTDIYATCSPLNGGANSPNALLGYQPSRTGTNHAGIILAEGQSSCNLANDNYREYIQGHTSSPLVAGQSYIVRFYVSLPEDIMAGSDDIGVYFSNTLYMRDGCAGQPIINVTPQLSYCGPCIMDTTNWVELKWLYTATGGEQYFIIGNFKNDTSTTVCPHHCGPAFVNPYIYYYIDDVEISPAAPNECAMSLNVLTTNTNCNVSNGAATVQVASCNGPFQYSWSNGGQYSSIYFLSAGSYTVTVTDGLSCSATAVAQVGDYTPPVVTVTTTNNCHGGDAFVTVDNSTGPFTYHWSNNSWSSAISNVPVGTYYVTVTGPGNCSSIDSAVIEGAPADISFVFNSTPAFCGNNNGTATAMANGGANAYLWSNGQTTSTIAGLAPGSYTVTVTPAALADFIFYTENFNSITNGWTFANGPGNNSATPNLWTINNNTDCNCNAGNYLHITCNPASFACLGEAECTYNQGSPIPNPILGEATTDVCAISPPISTVGRDHLALKFKYQVGGDGVSDYGLVRFSADSGLTWLDMPTKYSNVQACSYATVNIPSAFQDKSNFRFAFRWVNNNDGQGTDPGFAIDSVSLIESDAAACPAVATIVVGDTNSFNVELISTNAYCGQNNGTVTATPVVPGNYTYVWSNNSSGATIANLPGGNYSVTVSQGAGCSATASTQVVESAVLPLVLVAHNTTCGYNNGSVTAMVAGAGSYTYIWSNGTTGDNITNLSPGIYSVTVSDSICSATQSVNVQQSLPVSASFAIVQPTCGLNNGSIEVTGITAAQPVDIVWMRDSVIFSNNSQIGSLAGGVYSFRAVDSMGCVYDTVILLNPFRMGGPTIVTDRNVLCGSDTAVICAPGGYSSYLWSNTESLQCISVSTPGSYLVTVTDEASCSFASNELVIIQSSIPAPVVAVNGAVLQAGPGASYQWYVGTQAIPGATSATYAPIQSGNYSVEVTNADGCTGTSPSVQFLYNGLAVLSDQKVLVYPNPLQNGNWTLEVGNFIPGMIAEIFDATGRLVYHLQVTTARSEISITVAAGVYTIRVSANGNIFTQKLIKL